MNLGKTLVSSLALAAAGMWLYRRRAVSYARLHPELRSPLMRFRSPSSSRAVVKMIRAVSAMLPDTKDVDFERYEAAGASSAPAVPVYVYRPEVPHRPRAALLYMHGGGYMIGSASMFHANCARLARELGVVVANVDYRLAPETPFPGPLEDCYAALLWMKQQADLLGIDPQQIAVMGESAGAGLAAALAQLAYDRGEVQPAFQLLVYPMLDDRTALAGDHEGRGEFLWAPGSNRLGWSAYLGHAPTLDAAPAYAVPARRTDLSGLAPAWIGVGTLDLFYPESAAYARRLQAAGVPCELYAVEGAYHGFDISHPDASISQAFRAQSLAALRRGLGLA